MIRYRSKKFDASRRSPGALLNCAACGFGTGCLAGFGPLPDIFCLLTGGTGLVTAVADPGRARRISNPVARARERLRLLRRLTKVLTLASCASRPMSRVLCFPANVVPQRYL